MSTPQNPDELLASLGEPIRTGEGLATRTLLDNGMVIIEHDFGHFLYASKEEERRMHELSRDAWEEGMRNLWFGTKPGDTTT